MENGITITIFYCQLLPKNFFLLIFQDVFDAFIRRFIMPYPFSALTWADINLSHIAENIRALKGLIPGRTLFMAVVKANGYGHGSVEVAGTAIAHGADMLGVARVEEALELRSAAIAAPILIFGRTLPAMIPLVWKHDLTATVFDYEAARTLSDRAVQEGVRIRVHVKIDTGMGRVGTIVDPALGFSVEDAVQEIKKIRELQGIDLQGIYTHFATADEKDKTYAENQFNHFSLCLKALADEGIHIELRHCANSAALMEMPHTHLNMVRAGIAMYGLFPSGQMDKSRILLKPAMSLKTRIVQLKAVPAGFKVSYGSTFETRQRSVLATVPLGYADGYNRLFSSKGEMLVRGQRARVAGRVCMDQLVLDVTHIDGVSLEDEVVVIGNQGEDCISADELAERSGTIHYEIVSSILPRVHRYYRMP